MVSVEGLKIKDKLNRVLHSRFFDFLKVRRARGVIGVKELLEIEKQGLAEIFPTLHQKKAQQDLDSVNPSD